MDGASMMAFLQAMHDIRAEIFNLPISGFLRAQKRHEERRGETGEASLELGDEAMCSLREVRLIRSRSWKGLMNYVINLYGTCTWKVGS